MARFSLFKEGEARPSALPADNAPVPEPAAPDLSFRETVDLLETDLAAMIRDVARAAASVKADASASSEILSGISARTEELARGQARSRPECARRIRTFLWRLWRLWPFGVQSGSRERPRVVRVVSAWQACRP